LNSSEEKNKLNILFISHDASRTGAPIMLLNLLRYLKKYQILSFNVLLNHTGPLESEFSALAPTKLFRLKRGIVRKLLKILKIHFFVQDIKNKHLLKCYKNENFDLIYSNTIVNGEVLNVLSKLNIPIITHVHELEKIIEHYGADNWENVKKHTSYFVAASNAVKENLVYKRGISHDIICVIHEFIPAFPEVLTEEHLLEIRQNLNIPETAFVVCASGRCCARKGTDLFIQLANVVLNEKFKSNFFFLWVGGWPDNSRLRGKVHNLFKQYDLQGHLLFTGEVDNPLHYYSIADLFVLVSREDPFPLVCLESASLGKPVLCFANAGGMPEFVEEDAGCVIPYLDVEIMAEKIVELASNTEKLNQLGGRARSKVQKFYDTRVGAAKIMEVIHRVVGGEGGV